MWRSLRSRDHRVQRTGENRRQRRCANDTGDLPVPECPRIQVDKTPAGIIPHSTISQIERSLLDHIWANPWDAEIYCLARQMEAMSRHTPPPFSYQQSIILRRPETRYDVDFVVPSQSLIQRIQKLDHPDIHLGRPIRIMAAKKMVKGAQCVRVILAGWVPIGDLQPLVCVGIIQGKLPIRDRRDHQVLRPRRLADQHQGRNKRSLQEGSSCPVVMSRS